MYSKHLYNYTTYICSTCLVVHNMYMYIVYSIHIFINYSYIFLRVCLNIFGIQNSVSKATKLLQTHVESEEEEGKTGLPKSNKQKLG